MYYSKCVFLTFLLISCASKSNSKRTTPSQEDEQKEQQKVNTPTVPKSESSATEKDLIIKIPISNEYKNEKVNGALYLTPNNKSLSDKNKNWLTTYVYYISSMTKLAHFDFQLDVTETATNKNLSSEFQNIEIEGFVDGLGNLEKPIFLFTKSADKPTAHGSILGEFVASITSESKKIHIVIKKSKETIAEFDLPLEVIQ